MSRVEEMAGQRVTILLNRAIEAAMLEGPIEQRLERVDGWIAELENYRDEIPEELSEIKQIRNILSCSQQHFSPERELEINERLLELYVAASEGALIF